MDGDSPTGIQIDSLNHDVTHYSGDHSGGRPELLVLTQVLPFPPDAGPKVKTLNLIKFLAQDFDLTLVSFVRPDNVPEHSIELLQYCHQIYTLPMVRTKKKDLRALAKSLLGGQPFLIVRDDLPEMHQLLAELVAREQFVAVHADQLNMAQYALALNLKVRVLDEHNAVWMITDRLRKNEPNWAKKALLLLERSKLKRYELKTCRRFSRVLAVSPQDAASLKVACDIMPIGVDVEGTKVVRRVPNSKNLVSIATMFYPPNVEGVLWFGYNVFPKILEKEPQATFTVVGARPPASVYEMAAKIPGIQVTGYLKEVLPVLEQSAGLVVPLLSGGGMRVKILEALALGMPIVSTTVGAEGIEVTDQQTALLADNPAEFAGACLQLLESTNLGIQLAINGRKLARDRYDYRVAYAPLKEIYQELTAQVNEGIPGDSSDLVDLNVKSHSGSKGN